MATRSKSKSSGASKAQSPGTPIDMKRLMSYLSDQQQEINHAVCVCRTLRDALGVEEPAESVALLLIKHLNEVAEALDSLNIKKLLGETSREVS